MKKSIHWFSLVLLAIFLVGCADSSEKVTKDSQAAKPGMSAADRKDKRGD
jgi:hypothetical protein